MLIRFGDNYLNIAEVARVQINRSDDAVSATVELKNGNVLETSDSVEYLQTVLDAYHVISVQKLRDRLPSTT